MYEYLETDCNNNFQEKLRERKENSFSSIFLVVIISIPSYIDISNFFCGCLTATLLGGNIKFFNST